MTWTEWLLSRRLTVAVLRPIFWIGNYTERLRDWITFLQAGKKTLTRIAIIGDLSLQDPKRLDRVFAAAWDKADIFVQIGDMHNGYSVVKDWGSKGKMVLAIHGNHDTSWEDAFGKYWPRQWKVELDSVRLVGLDNGDDVFSQADWDILEALPADDKPTFVFAHKPLSPIVLPDGTENTHVMGESGAQGLLDASRAQDILKKSAISDCQVSGHYHGWTMMRAPWGDTIVEGRGGAGPDLGFTVISVRPEGWAIHRYDL